MKPKVIVIDGKTYKDVNEMPPDVREKYQQAISSLGHANDNHIPDAFESLNILTNSDKNGVPDILENMITGQAVVNSMKIVVEGKEFNGLEELPPEARARYDEAMGKLDANRNGIPDFVEGIMNTSSQAASTPASFGVETPRRSTPFDDVQGKPLPVRPTIAPDTSNGWMLVLAGLFLLGLCVAGAGSVWYFFLR